MKSIEEILTNCEIDSETGCWIWQLSANSYGHGYVNLNGKTGHAHRFIYEDIVGPVPEGTKLKQVCLTPKCCNPEHWELAAPTLEKILARTKEAWKVFVLAKSCLEWQGYIDDLGYGNAYWNGRSTRVHRITFEAFVETIPDELVLDHICQNRACCEFSHLRAVTQQENVRSGIANAAVNARKTECPKGHTYDEANTRFNKSGNRICRKCHSQSTVEARRKKRAENPLDPNKGPRSFQRNRIHCPKGHPYSGDNLYINPQGRRECRECSREAVRRLRARKKEQD